MPLYLVERNYAEKLDSSKEFVGNILDANKDAGVHWLFSFLSADKRKTYCLYEAPEPDALREAAKRAGLPADVIVEVSEANPSAFFDREEFVERSGHSPTRISPD